MSLKAAKIPPGGRLRRGSGQSAWDYPQGSECWDYPQGSRLFAHATDTDDAVTLPTAVSDCLGARSRQQSLTALAPGPPRTDNSPNWERVLTTLLRAGGANPPFSVFFEHTWDCGSWVPPGRVSSLHCPSLSSRSLVGSPLESGVSPAHIGPCNACHRAVPETTPLWILFLIKLSLSLSLSLSLRSVLVA
jgi:hypothetical protein